MLCAKGNLLDAAVKYGKRRRKKIQTDRHRERRGSPCVVPVMVPYGAVAQKGRKT